MWVFAPPGFTGIFKIDCKNRVKFDPAADLGDPAVGTVLAWSACMPSQSAPLKALKALQPLGAASRGHGVAGGDGAPAPTDVTPSGIPHGKPSLVRLKGRGW
jgi:hypothetical protein